MPKIIISDQDYQSLVDPKLQNSIEIFWRQCKDEWFSKHSRMTRSYLEYKQAKERSINDSIIQCSYPPNIKLDEELPEPTHAQKTRQNFLLKKWEDEQKGARKDEPKSYEFYDYDKKRPTEARWLRRLLDKWLVKLFDPRSEEKKIIPNRDYDTGKIQESVFQDPLLELYRSNPNNFDAVLKFCQELSDLDVMTIAAHSGLQRGPLGEYAYAVQKASGQKHKIKNHHEQAVFDLVNCASDFFNTITSFKDIFTRFTYELNQLKTDSANASATDNSIELDLDDFCHIEAYCRAIKSTILKSVEFIKLFKILLTDKNWIQISNNNEQDLRLHVSSFVASLFEIIMNLNRRLLMFNIGGWEILRKLQIELPLSQAELDELAKDQMENERAQSSLDKKAWERLIRKANTALPSSQGEFDASSHTTSGRAKEKVSEQKSSSTSTDPAKADRKVKPISGLPSSSNDARRPQLRRSGSSPGLLDSPRETTSPEILNPGEKLALAGKRRSTPRDAGASLNNAGEKLVLSGKRNSTPRDSGASLNNAGEKLSLSGKRNLTPKDSGEASDKLRRQSSSEYGQRELGAPVTGRSSPALGGSGSAPKLEGASSSPRISAGYSPRLIGASSSPRDRASPRSNNVGEMQVAPAKGTSSPRIGGGSPLLRSTSKKRLNKSGHWEGDNKISAEAAARLSYHK